MSTCAHTLTLSLATINTSPPNNRAVNLLLETEAGRQLLQNSGLLTATLPALQQRSTAATEAALSALAAAPAGGKAAPPPQNDPALAACGDAVGAAAFCARVAMHLAGLALLGSMVEVVDGGGNDGDDEEARRAAAPAARAAATAGLSQAVADAGSVLASAADWLAARADAAPAAAGSEPRKAWGAARRLADGAAALLGLAADALRMGLVELSPLEAETIAGAGRSALGLLVALQPVAFEGPVEGALKADTALLRLLLSPPAPAEGDAAVPAAAPATAGEQLAAWVGEWLGALSSGPLAGAAASVRAHAPALFGGLLQQQPAAAQQQQQSQQPQPWLAPLAAAVAEAVVERGVAGADGDADSGDAENVNPNARRRGGRGRKQQQQADEPEEQDGDEDEQQQADGGKGKAGAAGDALLPSDAVPPVVALFVQAARARKADRDAAARCLAAALSSGRGGDWAASLGALQLARLLGAAGRGGTAAAADAELRAGLLDVRAAAAAAKGRAAAQARLLVGQIDALSLGAPAAERVA